jgi:hypothetical protein
MSNRMARKRYSPQKKQEQVSRKQFEAFLEQHEWITGDIEPDLGEDILVRIYRDGISTGLSLYVQLKSVKSIAAHQLATGEISYNFDVNDLCHWDVQALMVVIVIWDVSQSAGWWISITDAIQYLNHFNPGWRYNHSAAVRIPFENRVDRIGLEKIRDTLVNLYWPVIAKGKDTVIHTKFQFPPTAEGQAKSGELKRAMASGDRIELDGRYIQEFTLPEWWERIDGAPDPNEMVLWIESKPSGEILPFQIEFQSEGLRSERIPYVEFKRVKQGLEEFTLSNAHQGIPLQIDMLVHPASGRFTFTIHANYVGKDGQTALQMINIARMCAQGGQAQMTALKTGKIIQFAIPLGSRPVPEPHFARFVENLAAIQQKTGKLLRIPDFASLTFGQMREAQDLASIVTTGRNAYKGDRYEIDLLKSVIGQILSHMPQDGRLYVQDSDDMVDYNLFTEQFELGPRVRDIQGKLSNSIDEMSAWYEQAIDQDVFKVTLTMPEIVDEYQNWLPASKEQDDPQKPR